MKKKSKNAKIGQLIIGSVALLFFLYGCFLALLWVAGQPVRAKVTSFRRELGERDETIRNKYTYVYSYEFSVDGQTYSGNSKKVQGPVFLKNDGNSFLTVHYLKCCPFLNSPEYDFKPWYKILIYFGVAFILGYFVRKIK